MHNPVDMIIALPFLALVGAGLARWLADARRSHTIGCWTWLQ